MSSGRTETPTAHHPLQGRRRQWDLRTERWRRILSCVRVAASCGETSMGDLPQPPSADRLRPALRLLMLIGLYAVPIITAVRPVAEPVFDSDLWWHLRVGQWVCQNHAIPTHDPFTL